MEVRDLLMGSGSSGGKRHACSGFDQHQTTAERPAFTIPLAQALHK